MKRYFRPLGILGGHAAHAAITAGLALPLSGALAYTLVEVIERDGPKIRRKIINPLSRETGERLTHPFGQAGEAAPTALPLALRGPHPLSRAGEGFIVMGIVNATPDSFSDGGLHFDPDRAIGHAMALIKAGASIVDIGGESTRPGALPVDPDEEIRRVLPVITGMRAAAEAAGAVISIDTRNARTMRAALDAGAAMINDVSALTHDPQSLALVAASHVPVVLMHMQGEPKTMQRAPAYDEVVLDVYDALEARIAAAEAGGILRNRIIADPGIGFGKTADHNVALLNQLPLFHQLGVPLLVGVSRKGFIGRLSPGNPDADRRLAGSLAAALVAVGRGARIVRVHDVAETVQALSVAAALEGTRIG